MVTSKKVSRNDIAGLLSRWSNEFTVYVPSRADGVVTWTRWDGKDTGFLTWYRNTDIPAKTNVLPLLEEMFHFTKDGKGHHLEASVGDGEKSLIFGVRPCDARAFSILDLPFQDGYADPYYNAKRQSLRLVGLTCTRPYDSCFCTSLGSGPGDATRVDLMLTDIHDGFILEEVTDKGRQLPGLADLKAPTEADEAKASLIRQVASEKIVRRVDVEDAETKLLGIFNDQEYWEKVASKCVSCGVCTFLCPTCYCFDINDEQSGNQGARFRRWDSCQFSIYTRMPMENPRAEKGRRVRQKVAHKFLFYAMNFESGGCVGCGRCIRRCPVNWDITQVLNALPEKAPGQVGERNAGK